ncbi:MAG: Tim44/TimA family putative adaptor protein [Alphaproteobacteria bacterium]|nr:Tim44/TimA family putative adaptor protein [Alphaproteobacteria bacterium]
MDSDFFIIIMAFVAGFVILRLRSVLGKRTGHERPPPADPFGSRRARAGDDRASEDEGEAEATDNVVRLPGRDGQEIAAETPLGAGLTQIKVADPRFDPGEFVEKAKDAFEYIVMNFAEGDTAALKPLLSKDVFEGFSSAIEERKNKDEKLETNLVRIKDTELLEAEMSGRTASITVKYITEQINVTRDKDGNVVDGDPDRIADVVDIWTYERNTRSSDPNWVLVATETPQ